jgi:hypothetical protein
MYRYRGMIATSSSSISSLVELCEFGDYRSVNVRVLASLNSLGRIVFRPPSNIVENSSGKLLSEEGVKDPLRSTEITLIPGCLSPLTGAENHRN